MARGLAAPDAKLPRGQLVQARPRPRLQIDGLWKARPNVKGVTTRIETRMTTQSAQENMSRATLSISVWDRIGGGDAILCGLAGV